MYFRNNLYKLFFAIILITTITCGCSPGPDQATHSVTKSQVGTTSPDHPGETMTVHYIDVGQGDAILVQSGGQNMLIDAGDKDHGQLVVDYLKSAGVKQIDILVVTHPHADHIGGMDKVIESFPVLNVYMPRVAHTSKSFDDLLTALENKNLKINTARAGITLPLASVNAYFLAPVKDYYEDLNNYSAVIKIVCGNKVFLFMGDAEKEAEDDMLAAGTDLKADVLKVGHHGSDSGTSTAFLNLVQPQYAIISVGEDNPYGHPHQETLNRLQECGSQIMRTDLNGTIVIHTDGNKLDIVIEKGE